jgi:DNA mismatch repair ATPase MutS
LCSFAVAAKTFNLNRPQLSAERGIYIKDGRHPLQELCTTDGTFIPNDTQLAQNREGAVQLITGPNGSGKSVYLKQVGLIVFMAQLGSFVSAESALIGICDRIFTRIGSRETIAVAESTFMVILHFTLSLCTLHVFVR